MNAAEFIVLSPARFLRGRGLGEGVFFALGFTARSNAPLTLPSPPNNGAVLGRGKELQSYTA